MSAREQVAEFLRRWHETNPDGCYIYGAGLGGEDPVVLRPRDLRAVLAELAAREAEVARTAPVVRAAVRWHEGRGTKGVEYVALTAALHAEIRALTEGDHHD